MMPESASAIELELRMDDARRALAARGIRPCVYCGMANGGLDGANAMCRHHTLTLSSSWARANRIYCDFFHRRIVLPADTPTVGDLAVVDGEC
jgi:hypothetical protein